MLKAKSGASSRASGSASAISRTSSRVAIVAAYAFGLGRRLQPCGTTCLDTETEILDSGIHLQGLRGGVASSLAAIFHRVVTAVRPNHPMAGVRVSQMPPKRPSRVQVSPPLIQATP